MIKIIDRLIDRKGKKIHELNFWNGGRSIATAVALAAASSS